MVLQKYVYCVFINSELEKRLTRRDWDCCVYQASKSVFGLMWSWIVTLPFCVRVVMYRSMWIQFVWWFSR